MGGPSVIASILILSQIEHKPIMVTLPIGTVITSELELTFEDKQDEFKMVTRDELVTTVTKLEGDQYTLQHKITPTFLQLDDLVRPTGTAEAADVEEVRSRFGVVSSLEGTVADPSANLMIAQLWSVPLPRALPRVGSDWTFEDNRQPHPFRFTGRVKLEMEGRINADVTIQGLFDNRLSATGTALLDVKTGWPLRIQLDAKNALVPGGERQTMNLTLRYETKSIKLPKS